MSSAKFINLLRADGELVETFADIGEIWKEWIKIYNADVPKKMFYIMYGWFDENQNWSQRLELDYMLINDIKYENKDMTTKKNRKLDTICMLVSIVRNDLIKLINRRSIGTHNMKITITRRDGHGTKSVHSKRRKKGEYNESFLTYHNTSHTQKTIAKDELKKKN